MTDLFGPLTEKEMEQLETFLLSRIDDDEDTTNKDEGIFDISSLDGFFTAVVSGPVMLAPSQWMAAIWGDFEPQWETEKEFEVIFTLLMRYMNNIAEQLLIEPESFEPLFMQREVEEKIYTIVDDWCYGYMMGVELCEAEWNLESLDIIVLITPIKTFGSDEGWQQLNTMSKLEIDNIRRAITPNAQKIHAYWLARRKSEPENLPFQRNEPRVGRNDPCPCGSGKKYKKCCLH